MQFVHMQQIKIVIKEPIHLLRKFTIVQLKKKGLLSCKICKGLHIEQFKTNYELQEN